MSRFQGKRKEFRTPAREFLSSPQLIPQRFQILIQRLCEGKAHDDGLFPIYEARKALANACQRLGLPPFSHRSLRRMFIVRCIEKGIDVKLISKWQGHSDGGKLILSTYSHINQPHEQRMAQLLSDGEPENVLPFMAKAEFAALRVGELQPNRARDEAQS